MPSSSSNTKRRVEGEHLEVFEDTQSEGCSGHESKCHHKCSTHVHTVEYKHRYQYDRTQHHVISDSNIPDKCQKLRWGIQQRRGSRGRWLPRRNERGRTCWRWRHQHEYCWKWDWYISCFFLFYYGTRMLVKRYTIDAAEWRPGCTRTTATSLLFLCFWRIALFLCIFRHYYLVKQQERHKIYSTALYRRLHITVCLPMSVAMITLEHSISIGRSSSSNPGRQPCPCFHLGVQFHNNIFSCHTVTPSWNPNDIVI